MSFQVPVGVLFLTPTHEIRIYMLFSFANPFFPMCCEYIFNILWKQLLVGTWLHHNLLASFIAEHWLWLAVSSIPVTFIFLVALFPQVQFLDVAFLGEIKGCVCMFEGFWDRKKIYMYKKIHIYRYLYIYIYVFVYVYMYMAIKVTTDSHQ